MFSIVRQTGVTQATCHGTCREITFRFALAAACLATCIPIGARAAEIEVINLNDSGPNSLRDAIENAASGDRIVLNVPGGGTITMLSDLPEITDSLSFTNPKVSAVVIDRNGNGPLRVTGGAIHLAELQVTGAGPDIVLSPAATLIGNIEQITADVTASGRIAPGSSSSIGDVGELIIEGDLDASNSIILIDVRSGPASSNDMIRVIGTADVTGATLNPTFAGSAYSVGDTFTVIDASASVNGIIANAAETFSLPSNPFLEASIGQCRSCPVPFILP